MFDAPWYVLLALFCVPAPVVGVALVARTRRLSWGRALFGAWLAQGVLVLALVVRAHTGMEGCARSDVMCFNPINGGLPKADMTWFRLQFLLVLGVVGTVSALLVGALATLMMRRIMRVTAG